MIPFYLLFFLLSLAPRLLFTIPDTSLLIYKPILDLQPATMPMSWNEQTDAKVSHQQKYDIHTKYI